MSNTPRIDAVVIREEVEWLSGKGSDVYYRVKADFARQLERELSTVRAELEDEKKRLSEFSVRAEEQMQAAVKKIREVCDARDAAALRTIGLQKALESLMTVWQSSVARLEANNNFGPHCGDEFSFYHGERDGLEECIDDLKTFLAQEIATTQSSANSDYLVHPDTVRLEKLIECMVPTFLQNDGGWVCIDDCIVEPGVSEPIINFRHWPTPRDAIDHMGEREPVVLKDTK